MFIESRRDRVNIIAVIIAVFLSLSVIIICSCGVSENSKVIPPIEYTDGTVDRYVLAMRFAPRLYLHAEEPYELLAIIPVFHPQEPIIAYHLFFEHDAILFGSGIADHEILWIQYDPVSLKTTDVLTLWHRTVIRTDECLMNAKASGQRPEIYVQWGQHGILPRGWRALVSVRPRLEFMLHYNIVHNLNYLPKAGSRNSTVPFKGTFDEYASFASLVDVRDYITKQNVIVANHSEHELKARLPKTIQFKVKKEWPYW